MTTELVTAIVSICLAIIGLASLSVILSKNAATSQVIQAGSAGLSTDITAAVSPITSGGGLGGMSLPSLSLSGNGL